MMIIRYIWLLLLISFLTACVSHPRVVPNHIPCSVDPYLAAYQCSLSRVQVAAKKGDADAAYALGYMYYYGIDTPPDLDKAKVWIAHAAELGQPLAKQAEVVLVLKSR